MENFKILTVTGASGSGKSSFVNHLSYFIGSDVEILVSTTTRQPRSYELDGRDYYFVSKEEFDKRQFLERVVFQDNFYGLELNEINQKLEGNSKLLLIVVEKQGAYEIKKKYPDKVLNLFIGIPPEKSKKRLLRRDVLEEKAIRRMEADKLANLDSLDYFPNEEGFFWDFYIENLSSKQALRKKSHLIADLVMGFLPPSYFDMTQKENSRFLKKTVFEDFLSKFKDEVYFLPMTKYSKNGIWFRKSILSDYFEGAKNERLCEIE